MNWSDLDRVDDDYRLPPCLYSQETQITEEYYDIPDIQTQAPSVSYWYVVDLSYMFKKDNNTEEQKQN